jgi:hypothetical protein
VKAILALTSEDRVSAVTRRTLDLVGAHRPNAQSLAEKAGLKAAQIQVITEDTTDLPTKFVFTHARVTDDGETETTRYTLDATGCQEKVGTTATPEGNGDFAALRELILGNQGKVMVDVEGTERLYVEPKGDSKLSAFESASADLL